MIASNMMSLSKIPGILLGRPDGSMPARGHLDVGTGDGRAGGEGIAILAPCLDQDARAARLTEAGPLEHPARCKPA